jgi:hypothetical protein
MKEFIYLDSSFLHSFIAQIYGGLPSSITNETQESRTETQADSRHIETAYESTGSLNAVFAKLESKISPKESTDTSVSLSQFDVGKEIISKQIHDNAVDDLISHLREKDLLVENSTNIEVNKYVLYRSSFKIIDLEFLKIFMTKDAQKLMGLTGPSTGGKPRKPQNNSINEFSNMIDMLSKVLPSDILIKQNKMLSPLRREYLRIQPTDLLFKYSVDSELCLLGKVCRKLEGGGMPNDFEFTNILSFSDMVLAMAGGMLNEFGLIDDGDYVVSPIAIFFESI